MSHYHANQNPIPPPPFMFAPLSHFAAEIGDFDDVQSRQHLLNNKYIPDQDGLTDKIIEYHRKHG